MYYYYYYYSVSRSVSIQGRRATESLPISSLFERWNPALGVYLPYDSPPTLVLLQCPVSCGGAVRSRSVTCVLAPRKSCDLTTKPRSRSLCALQSCPNSSLRRRPGPPTKYRRLFPPKSKSDTTTVRPRVPTTPVTTSAPSTPSPTSPLWETTVAPGDATTGALDGDDDYEFDITVKGNLIVKKENGGKPPPTEASALAENPEGNRAEEEEKDGEGGRVKKGGGSSSRSEAGVKQVSGPVGPKEEACEAGGGGGGPR